MGPETCPKIHSTLWFCREDSPPRRKEASVQKVGEVSYLCPLRFYDLPTRKNATGKDIKYFSFSYTLQCHGDSVDMAVMTEGNRMVYENFDIDSEPTRQPHASPTPVSPMTHRAETSQQLVLFQPAAKNENVVVEPPPPYPAGGARSPTPPHTDQVTKPNNPFHLPSFQPPKPQPTEATLLRGQHSGRDTTAQLPP